VRHRDALGNWSSTQATIVTLKAMLAAATAGPRELQATVEVIVNGTPVKTIEIDPENADVLHLIDATPSLRPGENTVTIVSTLEGRSGLMAQVTARSYVPWPDEPPADAEDEPLALAVTYDRSELATGDTLRAHVALAYRLREPAENAIVDLGVPPGFDVVVEDLDRAVEDGTIARYELTGRQIILYVAKLRPGDELRLDVGFLARYPLRAQAPASEAYLYYQPEVRSVAAPVEVIVTE